MRQKLSQGIMYYRSRDKSQETTLKELASGGLKWLDKYQLSGPSVEIINVISQDLVN